MFSFLFRKSLHNAKVVDETTVEELCVALAAADAKAEVVIYADLEGEWVEIPPYFDKRAAVCGYFSLDDVLMAKGVAVLTAGAEQAR